ncbi:MAG: hypothetical protein ACJ71T_08325 [Actinomycetales bacterium]
MPESVHREQGAFIVELRHRTGLVVLGVAFVGLGGSAAQASTFWGALYDYYGGNLVASGYGTYWESSSAELQSSTYQDRRADGHGAYVRANFQPFWHTCYPDPAVCHWEWGDPTVKKTPEIGTSNNVRTITLTTTRAWPTNRDWADVCIDVSLRPDPCVSSPTLYP